MTGDLLFNPSGSVFKDLRNATESGEEAIVQYVYKIFAEARIGKWKQGAGFQHNYWDRLEELTEPYGIDGGGSLSGYGAGALSSWIGPRKRSRENYIFQLIEAQKPTIIEQGIQFDVLPQNPDDGAVAVAIQDTLDYSADRDRIRREKFRKFISYMLKRGTGLGKVGWNPVSEIFRDETGHPIVYGNIETTIYDPKMVYVDPFATSFDDAAYVICAYQVDKDQLVERFGEKAGEAEPIKGSHTVRPRSGSYGANSPQDWPSSSGGGMDEQDTERDKRGVFVVELWIRPPRIAPTRLLESSRPQIEQEEAAIQAMGGARVITVAGGVLINDMLNPYDHGDLPFFSAQNYDVEDRIWGRATPEVLAGLQRELDWVNDHIRAYIKLVSTPFLVVPRDALIHFGQLSSKLLPLLRPQVGQASQWIRYVTPPPIPSQLFQRKADIISAMRKMEGIDEIDTSIIKGRQQAAASIQLVKEAGESRVRGKIDNVNQAFQRWARLSISVIQQMWTADRFVRLTGRKDEEGNPVPLRLTPDTFKKVDLARFDIKVAVAPGQALSRAIRYAQLIEMDSRAILGPPEPQNFRRRKMIAESAGVPGVLDMIVDEEAEYRKGVKMRQAEGNQAAQNLLNLAAVKAKMRTPIVSPPPQPDRKASTAAPIGGRP